MCGLVAFLEARKFLNPEDHMEKALDAIAHRGLPGLRGAARRGSALLGHVRLPIQGLGDEGSQPIVERDYSAVFVGEFLNYQQHDPGALCDAPVAMREWGLFGPQSARQWEGFWSFVFAGEGELTAAVDYLAQKPLYYERTWGVVASELRAIEAACPDLQLDELFLSNVHKWGYDPTGRTPYKSVVRIPPGHMLRNGTFIQYCRLLPAMGDTQSPMGLRSAIERAVRYRLVADVPVAVLCSGGLDSTIVALLAAKSGAQITVFHAENEEAEFVESIVWPKNVELRKVPLRSVSVEDAMRATEEPVDLGSVVPQYALGKAVHEAGFRVCLTGDGADELFGGYRRASLYDSQHSDVFCELVHYHLPRLDKTMMAHAVELRSPFLSTDVVERALGLPWSLRRGKNFLKEAFADLVPKKILEREKKPLRTKEVEEGGQERRSRLVNDYVRRFNERRS